MTTSKQRLITALERGVSDRLPVTTHHVMPYFLNKHMGGISTQEFFDRFELDPITWIVAYQPDLTQGEFYDPEQDAASFSDGRRIVTDNWRIYEESLPDPEYQTKRYCFVTPKGELSMVLQSNAYTSWVSEYLIKEKHDIELLAEFMPAPKCDVNTVNQVAESYGERGLVRSHICCFDVFGQPGTWQDAACIVKLEDLIFATYDDPEWVHDLLQILQQRKLTYVRSLAGTRVDLHELGGGAASSTVISPRIFETFVAPYDQTLIEAAHQAGQRIVYHTCGGMMPLLELIADMGPDAMETFTPPGMGADVDLATAKRRIGERVCMIGGFDQFHFFTGCSPDETRAEVRRCFEAAGHGGGYILSPSDHFFDAEPALIAAFADEAHKCFYD